MGLLSPLELLHPDGYTSHAAVLGGDCPDGLVPATVIAPGAGCDFIILAPTLSELDEPGWLETAARMAAGVLDVDGVVYVLVPRRWRRRAVRELSANGLACEVSLAHLPDSTTSRYLVPLAAGPASYAFSSLIPVRAWRRRLALAALAQNAGRLLFSRAYPSAGIVLRRPGARPLFDWLFQLDGSVSDGSPAVVTTGGNGAVRSFVLHRFSGDARAPTAVAKIRAPADPADGSTSEAQTLVRVAAGARKAGAAIPDPLAAQSRDGCSIVLETPVLGRTAAVLLGENSDRLSDVRERMAGWIEAWNRSTVVRHALTEERVLEDLIVPARVLAPLVSDGAEYLSWLMGIAVGLTGAVVPFVATHNDLTMSNLVITGTGRLGVVDWEAWREDGLPLVDALYGVADAAAAVERYDDRVKSFVDCFASEGTHAGSVRALLARQARALELSPQLVTLCFHACWLHHAANEHRKSPGATERPFLEILRWVARNRESGAGSDV